MDKPFRSIDAQIKLLQSRGVETDEKTGSILLREGYYQIVNGYKDPFIDEEESEKAGEDRYRKGTTFTDLYSLFRFDRDLRETTFHYLLRVEALMRTVVSYTFAEAHSGCEDYLDEDKYATEEQYAAFGLSDYADDLGGLLRILRKKHRSDERDFVKYYRENHDGVPIWVLANDLTFGNIEHFFNLMKPQEQMLCCKRVVEATGMKGSNLGHFSPREARIGLNLIVKTRNLCVHDERLYRAKIGKRQNATYGEVLGYVRRYLPAKEYRKLLESVIRLIDQYTGKSDMVGHILTEMHFDKRLDDLVEEIDTDSINE
jgi:abortive infection bacteriophage resistance protein